MWPEPVFVDENEEERGELAKEVIGTLRSWKAESGISLNSEIELVELMGEGAERLIGYERDIMGTIRARDLKIAREIDLEEKTVALRPVLSKIGPKFKARAKEIVAKLEALDPVSAALSLESGPIEVNLSDGPTIQITKDLVTLEKRLTLHGKEVKTFQVMDVLVAVQR
jgi:valyl-tRNA synthetase